MKEERKGLFTIVNDKGEEVECEILFTFDSEEIIHLRPSGNAPELRCYVEATSQERAKKLLTDCIQVLESFRGE